MITPLHNYSGNRKSLRSDACCLILIRILNVAAGERMVSFTRLWAEKDNTDFPISSRTLDDSIKRMTDCRLLFTQKGEGRTPSGYYASYCAIERISHALIFGLDDNQMFVPDDSPVCLSFGEKCECYTALLAIHKGIEVRSYVPLLPRTVVPRPRRLRPQRRRFLPYPIQSALTLMRQLNRLEKPLHPINLWAIPTVQQIQKQIQVIENFSR